MKLFVEEKAHDRNKNIDGFYPKTTQKGGFSKLCVKMEKRCYTDLLHFSTRKHSIFFRPNRIMTVELHRSFFYIFFFFQEKTLETKLETKIMNLMSVFFEKNIIKYNSSVVNNMQYNLFTIFPLSGPFAKFGFVFIHFITYFRF